jgi:hypothetical protein
MNYRHAPFAAASLSLLASLGGCAAFDGSGVIPKDLKAKPCPAERCDIEVTVKECKISVNDPVVEVRDQDNIMRWTIVSAGYEFDGKGIGFGFFAPFQNLGSNDPKVARVLNKNNRTGTNDYKYDVKIKGCDTLDPWVRNIR